MVLVGVWGVDLVQLKLQFFFVNKDVLLIDRRGDKLFCAFGEDLKSISEVKRVILCSPRCNLGVVMLSSRVCKTLLLAGGSWSHVLGEGR